MKKVITIMCLAAAPIIFAQQKASAESSLKKQVETEQVAEKQAKANQVEAQKKAEAEKSSKKSQVNATEQKATKKQSAADLNTSDKKKK